MGNIQYTVPVCILVEKESRQSVWWEAKLLGDFLLGEINIFVRNEIVVVAAETAQEKFFFILLRGGRDILVFQFRTNISKG